MQFDHPKLVETYGSWVKVQVKFYDFLLSNGINLSPDQFNLETLRSFGTSDWAYDRAVSGALDLWPTPTEAWTAFLKEEGVS